jgi:hypothetical protein
MTTTVITFVYNESVNLPIWRRYYGSIFDERNLFVIDHDSSDGSTDNLGRINRLWLSRKELDEDVRSAFVASFAKALLLYFDTVIYTDCDEMLIPDLSKYRDLREYVERNEFDYTAPVGLDLHHMVGLEPPLNLDLPILHQRRYARFTASMCKPLITRVPMLWAPGFHASNRPIRIDPDLFLVHLKAMDHDIGLRRQKLTRKMPWSKNSIGKMHGIHQRYDDERYTREFYLDPKNLLTSPDHGLQPFEFSKEISRMEAEAEHREGMYFAPTFQGGMVEIPDHLRSAI